MIADQDNDDLRKSNVHSVFPFHSHSYVRNLTPPTGRHLSEAQYYCPVCGQERRKFRQAIAVIDHAWVRLLPQRHSLTYTGDSVSCHGLKLDVRHRKACQKHKSPAALAGFLERHFK